MGQQHERSSINGKILKVNLSSGDCTIEEPDTTFYRKYLGGGSIGTYYCLKEMKAGVDPLSSENVLVFAPSILTGAAVSGVSRFNVTAKSPLTGCIGDSQCGGGWGPELKRSGFDAVLIRGCSPKPVYLWIHDGNYELKDASHLWGKFTAETREILADELGSAKIQTVCIGPAGEGMVRFACISGGSSDYAGRTGLGGVMGSKRLKAIVCKGSNRMSLFSSEGVKQVAGKGARRFKGSKVLQTLRAYGTPGIIKAQHAAGNLATRNFSRGYFEKVDSICGENLKQIAGAGEKTCYGCVVRCRHLAKAEKAYKVDPAYGGPEFETIALLGSNLEISDIIAVARGSQLCNAYGLDTISTGAIIAYLIESFENKLVSEEQTEGLELKFADPEVMLRLIEKIGNREGIGNILSEGMDTCIKEFGDPTAEYAIQVKNNPSPQHLPQVKMSQALAYAINPFGADHMSSEHDWLIEGLDNDARSLGLDEERKPWELDHEKVRMVVYSQIYYSLLDTLCLCAFCWGPGSLFNHRDLESLIYYATGMELSNWELMKAGERRINLMRAFNAREGISSDHDRLPKRFFQPMAGAGAGEGKHVREEDFKRAIKTYYSMMNWDPDTGNPTMGKLQELGLSWVLQL